MKLNKYQKSRLLEYEWDVVETEVNGEIQNCRWVNIESEDGAIFGEVCKDFCLTGEEDCVKLLVIGTQEG